VPGATDWCQARLNGGRRDFKPGCSKTVSLTMGILTKKIQSKINIFAATFFSVPGNITRLVLRSRLNLSELLANKLFAIVFQLIYVMSEEFAKPVVVDNADDQGVKKKRVKLTDNYYLSIRVHLENRFKIL
jgi:hypothetical protein